MTDEQRAHIERALSTLVNLQPIIANGLLDRRQLAFIDPHHEIAMEALEAVLIAQQAEPVPEPEPQTCTWQQDGDSDSGVYGTSCRRYFNLEDGTPEDNKMQWCCYCGKKLVQELITEDEDE